MWEAIRGNRRRSTILIWLMGAVLVLLGYVIGLTFGGDDGGIGGILIALIVWIILLASALWGGKQILISSTGAVPI